MPDVTETKQPQHLFKPGQSGNPAGRPIGSRNKLATQFIDDLQEVHSRLGKAAIERVALEEPGKYMSIVASILPKNLDMTLAIHHDMFANAQDWVEAFRMAREYIGAEPIMLEADGS